MSMQRMLRVEKEDEHDMTDIFAYIPAILHRGASETFEGVLE